MKHKINSNNTNFFGWNEKAWSLPFKKAVKNTPLPQKANILEIGADGISSIALYFIDTPHSLTITCYPPEKLSLIQKYIQPFKESSKAPIKTQSMSVTDIKGEYDLIIMKSILGGVFRKNNSSLKDINELLRKIKTNNLTPNGSLITLDNGATSLEPLYSKFGARANNWRFFLPTNFKHFTHQYTFGWLSSFSFSTRFGKFGKVIENTLYYFDKAIYSLFPIKSPSIIVTVYTNEIH